MSWNPRTGEFRLKEQRKPGIRKAGLAAMLLVVGVALMFSFAGRMRTGDDRDDLPHLVKRVQPAVVTVIAYNARGKALSQGSGFFIPPGDCFLTNYHVLAQAVQAEVRTAGGRSYPVRGVVAADRDGDLVVGAVADHPGEGAGLRITCAVPEVGARVAVVGSPLGLEQTLSDGVVSAIRRTPAGSYLQISAPVSPGSSGSPVINMKGEVVGVASLQVIEGQNLNFAVPGSRALALQERAAVRRAATPLTALGREPGSLWRCLDRDQRFAGEKQGCKSACRPDSRFPPESAGACTGLGRLLDP